MFCGNCGAQIPDDADFCPNCGAVVNQNIEQMNFEPTAESSNGNSHGSNKKLLVLGVCCAVAVLAAVVVCAAVFVKTLSGSGSDSSVSASSDNTRTEEKSADDGDTNEEISKQETVVTEANAKTEEEYIKRLEAYQEYYDSVKDEDENYEVLAALSLDEDNLPILWLVYTDKDKLEKDDNSLYINYDGYIRAYGYEKKNVTLLAETSKYSTEYLFIDLTRQDLSFATFDSTDSSRKNGAYYEYDSDSDKFVKYRTHDVNMTNMFTRGYLTAANEEEVIYLGYWDVAEEDIEPDVNYDENISYTNYYWWDGTQFTAEDWRNFQLLTDTYYEKGYDIDNDSWGAFFLNDDDFSIFIKDLEESPIYDINMFAIKCQAVMAGWYYNTDYGVEYLDLDSIDDFLTEAKVDSALAEIENSIYEDVIYEDVILGYQILDWDEDGSPEIFINYHDENVSMIASEDIVYDTNFCDGFEIYSLQDNSELKVFRGDGLLVSYDKDSCVIKSESGNDFDGDSHYIYSFDDNGLEERHSLTYSSVQTYYLDFLDFASNDEAVNNFNSYLAEYSLTEFSWSSYENLEEDLRNFYLTATVNENAQAKEYVPTAAEQEVIDAKNAYAEYLQYIFGSPWNYKYAFVNIDGDAIPEIFCREGSPVRLLFYDNGTVNCYDTIDGIDYIVGENQVYYESGRTGEYETQVFHLENGSAVIDLEGTFFDSFDENGEFYYAYYLSGEEVSEEKYYNSFSSIFDFDRATSASASWSYDSIMNYLQ